MPLSPEPTSALPPKPEFSVSPATSEVDIDPWALPDLQDQGVKWSDLNSKEKFIRVVTTIGKILALVILLYLFICSLDFLASAFRLLGGKAAGKVFQDNKHLRNPVVGLMIGVLATVLVQSSSTSTSIIVTMVASDFLEVQTAIPIIMGANIGTSVTNTIVSLAQSGDRNEFRRAFGGATVHDMFNWLTVGLLLPIEVITGYQYYLTKAIVDSMEWSTSKGANKEMLTLLTKPFTSLIMQLDSKVIEGIAMGDAKYDNKPLIKEWCKSESLQELKNVSSIVNTTSLSIELIESTTITEQLVNTTRGVDRCKFLLNNTGLGDSWVGLILLVISLVLLCGCLILMVKILHSMLRGQIATVIRKTLNSDFPPPFGFLTGYVAILVGCIMTILVQSSSIFTSALTPLVGMGVISLERMYPLTLGSNIGTTTTGVLASLTATGSHLKSSVQIALCHLCFNVTGILIFYPIPFTRIPIKLAQMLGNTTAKYRWFSVLYLIMMFFVMPACVFLLSLAGALAMMIIGIPVLIGVFFVIVLNVMQRKFPKFLPERLRNWEFLPEFLRSLAPLDRRVIRLQQFCGRYCCKCCTPAQQENMASLYNTSFHSRTAILNQSALTLHPNPSTNSLMTMKTMPNHAQDNNGFIASGPVVTSAV